MAEFDESKLELDSGGLRARSRGSLLGPSLMLPLYVLLIMGGHIFFRSDLAMIRGNELSRHQALFVAVNAASLTGFQMSRNVNEYRPAGQAVTLALTIAGTLFSLLCGGAAIVRICGMRILDRRLLAWCVGLLIVVSAVGMVLAQTSQESPQAGVFTAISALGNSGLFLGKLPAADSPVATLVLMPLAVIGGLGIAVLIEIVDAFRGDRLSTHARTVVSWTAAAYLIGVVLLLILQWPGEQASLQTWKQTCLNASVQSLNARSAGFPFQFASYWPRTVQWTTLGLMLFGGAPGGTAGGLKVTTLAVLLSGAWSLLHGRPVGRVLGMAMAWVGIYSLMIAASMLWLLNTEPQMAADRVLFLAVSALGNVGLSHDTVTVSDAGLYALSAAMLVGRVAPVMVLWWMADSATEATIAIG